MKGRPLDEVYRLKSFLILYLRKELNADDNFEFDIYLNNVAKKIERKKFVFLLVKAIFLVADVFKPLFFSDT